MPDKSRHLQSCEDRLEENTVKSLESVTISMMRKFANRSLRFMSAYNHGLNGKQAVWAAKKYKGHCVLPSKILEELKDEGVV